MAITDKYELEEVAYGTTGWNAILTANMQKVEAHLHTRLLLTAGEAIAVHEAVYMGNDSKVHLAQADKARQPALGLAVDAGEEDDEIRVQRVGPVTNAAWSWLPGLPVYLSAAVAGGLQHGKPVVAAQLMGIAIAPTTLLLCGTVEDSALATTTTTTTSTTTTTTTSAPATTTTTTTGA